MSALDRDFLEKVKASIVANISNENYGLATLSQNEHISSRQLQRKLKALTDRSPSQMIRWMRMQKALQLLENRAGTVSEIAFKDGYKSVAYFTKSFREDFGKTPSEV